MNWGDRTASPTDISACGPPICRGCDVAARERRRAPHQQRYRNHDDGNDPGDDLHRRSPIMDGDEPGHQRRHGHGRYTHAGRHQRNREAAMGIEPAGDGSHHRRKDRGNRTADQDAEGELKRDKRCRLAGERQAHGEHRRSRQHDRQRPPPVGQGAPGHAGAGHGKEADRHRARDASDRPAGITGDGLKQHGQRKHRADRDAAQDAAGCDNDPAIARIRHSISPFLFSGHRTNGAPETATVLLCTARHFFVSAPIAAAAQVGM